MTVSDRDSIRWIADRCPLARVPHTATAAPVRRQRGTGCDRMTGDTTGSGCQAAGIRGTAKAHAPPVSSAAGGTTVLVFFVFFFQKKH